jgi:hypothetical protein
MPTGSRKEAVMARQATASNGSRAPSAKDGSKQARQSSSSAKKYGLPNHFDGDGTVPAREYRRYADDERDPGPDPDVLLDVPVLNVASIHLELDDLDAHVALKAQVLDLVSLTVGLDVHLGKVRLDISGVEAQALLKVRLDHVTAIVDRVLTTIDRNPELIKSLGSAVEDIGLGARGALNDVGGAVQHVGKGLQGAVEEVGEGAGQAVSQIGEGAGQAVGQIGSGAGQAVGQVGAGAGEAVGQVGQVAGEAVGEVGQAARGAGLALDDAVQRVGENVGQRDEAAGQSDAEPSASTKRGVKQFVSEAGKTAVKEVESAPSGVKMLGVAATRKAKDLGRRLRHRHAERHPATEAPREIAEEQR